MPAKIECLNDSEWTPLLKLKFKEGDFIQCRPDLQGSEFFIADDEGCILELPAGIRWGVNENAVDVMARVITDRVTIKIEV